MSYIFFQQEGKDILTTFSSMKEMEEDKLTSILSISREKKCPLFTLFFSRREIQGKRCSPAWGGCLDPTGGRILIQNFLQKGIGVGRNILHFPQLEKGDVQKTGPAFSPPGEEKCVLWFLQQKKHKRPEFFLFFFSGRRIQETSGSPAGQEELGVTIHHEDRHGIRYHDRLRILVVV